jgi:pimeloyl-ACP methyl ester carboxylesterase
VRRHHRRATGVVALLLSALPSPRPAAASEPDIVANLEAFLATDDLGERTALATAIERDPDFDRRRLSGWLHQARLFAPQTPGTVTMAVDVGRGEQRLVTVRVPRGYDPTRAYPVLYLLHPSGGSGSGFLSYADTNLGPRIDDWIVVAPSNYRQTGLDAPPPFTADHSAILRAVRTRFHVDADRQYVMGFSLGGYGSWAVALLYAEEVAGAVPVGSAFTVPPGEDGLWADVLPDLAHVQVLNVWGSQDTLVVLDMLLEPGGTVPELNHRFMDWTAGWDLPIRHIEVPGRGHEALAIAWADLEPILTRMRPHYPTPVDHTFRHVHQGRAYWLEAEAWQGESWDTEQVEIRRLPGESRAQAFGREVRSRLGRLQGSIEGQTIRVDTQHVAELTVWVGDEGRDWTRPVTLVQDGKRVFRGRLKPDLLLALTQAARTRDFENLRWSGWRVVRSPKPKATVVTAKTAFPPLVP